MGRSLAACAIAMSEGTVVTGGAPAARRLDKPKTRAAFAAVAAISSSTGRPRTAAIRSATWRTKAGSFRLPRCGTGAR